MSEILNDDESAIYIDAEEEEIETAIKLRYEIDIVCSDKLSSAKGIFIDIQPSYYIENEYNRVYKAILDNDIDFFEIDAMLLDTTAKEEFDKAKAVADVIVPSLETFSRMIRGLRRFLCKELELGNYDGVEYALEEVKSFDKDTLLSDILSLKETVIGYRNG